MRAVFYLVGSALAPLLAQAQPHPPRFAAYPAAARYTGRRVAPRLRPGTAAWYFRTRIREAAQGPPNFAGHYVLASWGCGAECLSSAIIDARTGAVYLVGFTSCCWYTLLAPGEKAPATDLPEGREPVDFRLNSRLVVFAGLLNEKGSNGLHYFTFAGGKLTALR